jgi:endoglucanase
VRVPLAVLLALALAGLTVLFAVGCGGDDSSDDDGSATATTGSGADASAQRFLDRYVTAEGRVQRIDEGGDTVGEGQAYGMLLAAASGDEQRFDVIWEWTKSNLRRPDGLISFLWRDGRVVDPEAASDADVDAARALLVAGCRFDRPALRREALELGEAILSNETASFQGAPVLTAGPWARTDPVTLNPSYFSPATFAALGTVTGDGRWGSLSASSRSVTETLMPEAGDLPPDWASIQGDTPVPSGPPGQPEAPPRYGFDAPRTLVRMAEDPDPAGRRIAAGAWAAFEGRDPADIPVEHDLSGEPADGTLHPVALVAAAAAADAAGEADAKRRLLDAAEALDRRTPTYYGAAWVALGRVMLDTSTLDVCP